MRARQRLVAALSTLGRSEEAHTAAAELDRLQHDLNVDYINTTYPFQTQRIDLDLSRLCGARAFYRVSASVASGGGGPVRAQH